jgi:hypothetical protein
LVLWKLYRSVPGCARSISELPRLSQPTDAPFGTACT